MWSRRMLNVIVLRPLAWALLRAEITGRENIPANGPFILAVNHCSFLDPGVAIIAMLPREVTIFSKVENLHLPVGGRLLRWYGALPVERGEADVAALKRAVGALSQDQGILLISPEGTRSYHGRLLPAKNGMAFIATRADVPILPVGVTGVRVFWANLRRLRRTHVRAVIGHPFRFRSRRRARKETLQAMTREAMYQLAALLPREQWGAYADMENATEEHLEFLEPGGSNLAHRALSEGRALPGPLAGAME